MKNQTALVSLSILSLCVSSSYSYAAKKDKHPNVIFIMTDDQGYPDLACYGNPFIKTPNIDALHADAVRFTDYHVSPTSAPSRSGIMTGRYSDRVGVWHTIQGRSIAYNDEKMLPEVFSANGYNCGIFGKWHLGECYPNRPEDRGFDRVVIHGGGGIGQGPDYWGNDYFNDHYRTDGEWKPYTGYCTDVFFDEAISFIEKSVKKGKPFFCYLPTNAPHSPLNVPLEYLDLYKDMNLSDGDKRFYAMVTNIDDNLAKLDAKLEKLGIKNNTILIFTTDNGTTRPSFNMGKTHPTFTGFLRGEKNTPYEGGHNVPFFVRYPDGGLDSGRDITTLISHIDLMPTFIDYLGFTKNLPDKELDGSSFAPLLKGEEVDWQERSIIVDSQRGLLLRKWKRTAVMYKKWRFINNKELYNLETDPQQKVNIADQHPDIVKRLVADYETFWADMNEKEKVNDKFGYNIAGGDENPIKINAHDLYSNAMFHPQYFALSARAGSGVFKVGIETKGRYKFSMYRYPREAGYKINEYVQPSQGEPGAFSTLGRSKNVNWTSATIKIGDYSAETRVDMNKDCVEFEFDLSEGYYDLDARFLDSEAVAYPSYYLYIEKL